MALFSEAFAKNRTDRKAKPVRSIFDIVVDLSVKVCVAGIKWSFFHVLAIKAKKDS